MDSLSEHQLPQGLTLYFLGKLHNGLKKLSAYYRQRGVRVFNVTSPDELDRAVNQAMPHALVIDLQSRSDITSFFDVLGRYDDLLALPRVAIISSTTDKETSDALKSQADEAVVWPLKATDLSLRLFQLLISRDQLVRFHRDGRTDPGSTMRGEMYEYFLRDIIQLLFLGRKDCVLSLECEGRRGNLYFKEGKLIDAQVGALEWEDSLALVRRFKSGSFVLSFQSVDRKKFIDKGVTTWLTTPPDETGELPLPPEPTEATSIGPVADSDLTQPDTSVRSIMAAVDSSALSAQPAKGGVFSSSHEKPTTAAPSRSLPGAGASKAPLPTKAEADEIAKTENRSPVALIGFLVGAAVVIVIALFVLRPPENPTTAVSSLPTLPSPMPAPVHSLPSPTPLAVHLPTPEPTPPKIKETVTTVTEVVQATADPARVKESVQVIAKKPGSESVAAAGETPKVASIKTTPTPAPNATPSQVKESPKVALATPAPIAPPTAVTSSLDQPTPVPAKVVLSEPAVANAQVASLPAVERPEKFLGRGRELEKSGKIQEALSEYTRAAEIDPTSREAAEAIARLKNIRPLSPTTPGTLMIDSYPYGVLYVDGEKMGYTPVNLKNANPRKYLIRVVNPEHGTCSMEYVLKPGETKLLRFRLDDKENCQRAK